MERPGCHGHVKMADEIRCHDISFTFLTYKSQRADGGKLIFEHHCMRRPAFGAVGGSEVRCGPCLGEVLGWDQEQARGLGAHRCGNLPMEKPHLQDAGVQSSVK